MKKEERTHKIISASVKKEHFQIQRDGNSSAEEWAFDLTIFFLIETCAHRRHQHFLLRCYSCNHQTNFFASRDSNASRIDGAVRTRTRVVPSRI